MDDLAHLGLDDPAAYWRARFEEARARLAKLWLMYERVRQERDDLRDLHGGVPTVRVVEPIVVYESRDDEADAPLAVRPTPAAPPTVRAPEPAPEPTAPSPAWTPASTPAATPAASPAAVPASPAAAAAPPPVAPGDEAFRHGPYTLYSRPVRLADGLVRPLYFFSKHEPRSGAPAPLPPGFEVAASKTGLPVLRRAGVRPAAKPRPQCAALTQAGVQCRGSARQGSRYCVAHRGYRPSSIDHLLEQADTKPRARGAKDTRPALRQSRRRAS